MDDKIFYLKIRNSNNKNIPVFPNLKATLTMKCDMAQSRMSILSLEECWVMPLKQILSLGYVLLHAGDDGTAFER